MGIAPSLNLLILIRNKNNLGLITQTIIDCNNSLNIETLRNIDS